MRLLSPQLDWPRLTGICLVCRRFRCRWGGDDVKRGLKCLEGWCSARGVAVRELLWKLLDVLPEDHHSICFVSFV